jgi:hypothetical protein
VIVALALIFRGSCRGVIEFMRELLGVSIGVGTIRQVLQSAARTTDVINHEPDLSANHVGRHDELFQDAMPVLAGVDAVSTYCYLLAAADHRDANTGGVHLFDATRQRVRAKMGGKFHTLFDAVSRARLAKVPAAKPLE